MNWALYLLLPLLYSPSVSAFELSPNPAIRLAAYMENVDPDLLSAVCYVESLHNPKAIVPNDGVGTSFGLCQIKAKTARWLGLKRRPEILFNPYVNALYAAKYLRYQMNRYQDEDRALAAYNAGSSPRPGYNQKYINKVREAMRDE